MGGILRKAIRSAVTTHFPIHWSHWSERRSVRNERRHWDVRIADVLACPDNSRLARVPDAGKTFGEYQVMHNGLKVVVGGDYGDGIARMLSANRGCHEPQEEVVFDAVVKGLPSGSVMVELGAYWSFYSTWLCEVVQNARVCLVEPLPKHLAMGRRNFKLNGYHGSFAQAYIGASDGMEADGSRVVSVESLLEVAGHETIQLLHADVQGHELSMLQGARTLLEEHRIDYLFISTHRADLHASCEEFLRVRRYRILASANLEETYSSDGILVACSPRVTPPAFAPPSKRGRPGAPFSS